MHKYESVSHSVVSDSLTPLPSPGDLPNPGIKPRFPTLQADPLPAEPQGKPKNTGVGSLSLLQIFLTQESNQGLLNYRQILYQLSYQESPTWVSDNSGFAGGSDSKESAHNARTWVQSLGWEDPLEKGMATHSSILAWRIPWTV